MTTTQTPRRRHRLLGALMLCFTLLVAWLVLKPGHDGEFRNSANKPVTFRGQIIYILGPNDSCGTVARQGRPVTVLAGGEERTAFLSEGVMKDEFCRYTFSVAAPFSGRTATVTYDNQNRRVVLRDGLSPGGVDLTGRP